MSNLNTNLNTDMNFDFNIEGNFKEMFSQISQLERKRNNQLIKQEIKLRKIIEGVDYLIETELKKIAKKEIDLKIKNIEMNSGEVESAA